MSSSLKLSLGVLLSFIFLVEGKGIFQVNYVANLTKLKIDTTKITVSGFSEGSAMATQMHIAHSDIISGAALFSMAYYRCGPTSIIHFGLTCSKVGALFNFPPYNISRSIANVYEYEKQSLIDPIANLDKHKVYVWSGEEDRIIAPETAKMNFNLYSEFITNQSQISVTIQPVAIHQFPSDSFGLPCGKTCENGAGCNDTFRIANCNYSGAYESLKFILGDDMKKPEGVVNISSLLLFNQSEVWLNGRGDIGLMGLAPVGFLYIPEFCNDNECLLHIHFHGCSEGIKRINDTAYDLDRAQNYSMNNGLIQMAEVNNIVLLFPQTMGMKNYLRNFGGCWDYFSYYTAHYATKEAPQIRVIHEMISRLTTEPEKQEDTTAGSISIFNKIWHCGISLLSCTWIIMYSFHNVVT